MTIENMRSIIKTKDYQIEGLKFFHLLVNSLNAYEQKRFEQYKDQFLQNFKNTYMDDPKIVIRTIDSIFDVCKYYIKNLGGKIAITNML
jgi:hypothetical protein